MAVKMHLHPTFLKTQQNPWFSESCVFFLTPESREKVGLMKNPKQLTQTIKTTQELFWNDIQKDTPATGGRGKNPKHAVQGGGCCYFGLGPETQIARRLGSKQSNLILVAFFAGERIAFPVLRKSGRGVVNQVLFCGMVE